MTVPNKVPAAVDDVITTNEDTPVIGAVATNDTLGDPANTWVLVGVNGGALHGTVTMATDGGYTYTPAANFSGVDVFTYKLCDKDTECSQAKVTVTINAVNDLPAVVNDSSSTHSGVAVTSSVVANDTQSGDGGNLWSLVGTSGGAAHGTVTMTTAGAYTYTPAAGYSGTDTFTYQLCDVTPDCVKAVVTVTIANRPPVAVNDSATAQAGTALTVSVLTNDSDPDGDPLKVVSNTAPTSGTLVLNANGTFTYTPLATFSGTVTFTYTITDGNGGTATATVTILVQAKSTCGTSDGRSGKSRDGASGKTRDGRSSDGHSGDSKSCDGGSTEHKSGRNHGDQCHGVKGHGHHDHDGCLPGNHGHWTGDGCHGSKGSHHDGDGCLTGKHGHWDGDNDHGTKGGHHDGDGCLSGKHGHWDGDGDHGVTGGHHDGDGCLAGKHGHWDGDNDHGTKGGHHDGDGCTPGKHGHWEGDNDHGAAGGHHDGDGCLAGNHGHWTGDGCKNNQHTARR